MTGVECTTMFQRCPDLRTICFHGASCVKGGTAAAAGDGNDKVTYFCDCSTTISPSVMYTGQHCEYEVTTLCDTTEGWWDVSENGQWICANDATCATQTEGSNKKCNCPTDYEGPHCEFPQGAAPECNLKCFHGGICNVGMKQYQTTIAPSLRDYFGQYEEEYEEGGVEEQHCLCPKGFTGRQCEASISDCDGGGDSSSSSRSHQCLNGGECGSSSDDTNFFDDNYDDGDDIGGDGAEYRYCNCGTASSSPTEEGGLEVQFAGNACESASSTFCPTPSGFDQLDFYCTNGGVCGDNSWDKCVCSADYSGPRCEFLVQYHTDCDLQCQNGGTCFFGDDPTTTPYNALDIGVQPPPPPTPTLDPSSISRHCKCPDGFIGDTCESVIEICGRYEHHCLNGGLCVDNGDEYTCDCRSDDGLVPHAGEYCQHVATVICKGAFNSFCTNNGICKDVIDTEDHPGCVCSDGFAGEYCEISPETMLKVIVKDVIWLYVTLFFGTVIIFVSLLLYYYLPKGVYITTRSELEDDDISYDDDEEDIPRDDVLPDFEHYLT